MDLNDGSESDFRGTTVSSSSRPERRVLRETGLEKQKIGTMNRRDKWETEADEINLDRVSQNFEYLSVYGGEERTEKEGMRYSKEGRFARSGYDPYEYQMPDRNGLNRAENTRLEEMEDESIRSGNTSRGKGKAMSMHDSWMAPPPPPPPGLIQRRDMAGNGSYSPQHPRARAQGYGGSSRSQMVYTDSMDPYQPLAARHHPSCSCFQCNTREAPLHRSHHYHKDGSFDSYEHPQRNPSLPSRTSQTRRRPHRMRLSAGALQCRPLARGAPFLTCYNCFVLLMLPKKVSAGRTNDRKKIRCGECSTMICFTISDKNLIVLNDDEVEIMDIPTNVQGHPVQVSSRGNESLNRAGNHSPFEDFDDSGYQFQPMDRELGQLPADKGRESEKQLPDKVTENPTTGMTSATEIDVPSNEYANNTGTTIGSGEGTRGDHRSKAMSYLFKYKHNKVVEDSNGSDQTDEPEKANVTVNGHLVPDRLIRKAEKFAGPIEPGHYWYDSRAGFWGVMGGSCMGIIPPFIGEFNYPMADNCSGGNTGVFVNGRELSHKDLNLLAKRGLPLEQDRSYIVEISGRILCADTGAELPSLGKLAPSLEKAKRGNGMRDPNAPAQPAIL